MPALKVSDALLNGQLRLSSERRQSLPTALLVDRSSNSKQTKFVPMSAIDAVDGSSTGT
jgi:hypothetical protein